jgi:hypothetical protein
LISEQDEGLAPLIKTLQFSYFAEGASIDQIKEAKNPSFER